MTFLLDTNVLSELRRPNQAERRVLNWFGTIAPAETFISAISIAELEQGAVKAERKQLPHAPVLRAWIDTYILRIYAGRILPVDAIIALQYGRLQPPDPLAYADVMIAATALVHGLTVVTRNTRHFAAFSVPLLNPWTLP